MRQKWILCFALLGVLVTGCAKKTDDAAIIRNIQSQMFSDQQLKGSSLQVGSDRGEVTLTGSVDTDAARLDAYKIATQTPGVAKVNDQMTVAILQAQPEPAPVPTPRRAEPTPPAPSHRIRTANPPDNSQNADSTYIPPPADPAPAAQQAPPDPLPSDASAAPPPAPPPPPVPQPTNVDVPADTTLTIRMIDAIDSQVNHAGEIFHASLDVPIVVENQVVVPRGADVYVRLASASSSGKFTGKSQLHLELVKLEFQGQSYPLVSGSYSLTGSSTGKSTGEKVGGGAVLGAIIGAIAGGGKGAAIGAGVGAAGGGVYQGATGGKQVKIPSETKLDFKLDQPLTVTVMPRTS